MPEGDPTIYKMPTDVHVSEEQAPKLYRLEETRDKAIQAAAKELQRYLMRLHGREVSYWGEAMPGALLNILNSFVDDAAINAAMAYLMTKGFTVDEKETRDL
jgi:hypothetical protein